MILLCFLSLLSCCYLWFKYLASKEVKSQFDFIKTIIPLIFSVIPVFYFFIYSGEVEHLENINSEAKHSKDTLNIKIDSLKKDIILDKENYLLKISFK